jgi:hypothetical protein
LNFPYYFDLNSPQLEDAPKWRDVNSARRDPSDGVKNHRPVSNQLILSKTAKP